MSSSKKLTAWRRDRTYKTDEKNFKSSTIIDEQDLTRKIYIDTLLREGRMGPVQGVNVAEYLVHGMPEGNGNEQGKGYVDYVLWDDNGKPLAVEETKRTKRDWSRTTSGKLYADCLGVNVINAGDFYSNGTEHGCGTCTVCCTGSLWVLYQDELQNDDTEAYYSKGSGKTGRLMRQLRTLLSAWSDSLGNQCYG